jgi:uncharacterized protein
MINDERVLSSNVMTELLTADQLSPSDVIAGSPQVASTDLETVGGVSIGVWEITEGTVTDTEVNEVFLVLAGSGHIAFDDGSTVTIQPRALMSAAVTTLRWRHLVPSPSMCPQ